MSHFTLIQRESVPALRLTVESYRHDATGARHFHLAADDPHNAFLVAFLTVPEDSTGVAHILEHTALCGSRRYPVRDPFFMMLRRSLQTFMNAFTSSDWTAYPFASQCRKDFFNLMDVYLDAAFFPNLDAMDFSQEGFRVELADGADAASPLVFKGVVFNEMKGAMSSPARVLWDHMAAAVFPTITYHHNSGGDPEAIPDLTWEQLRAFHAKHYHPSNAIFMTYGDITATEHQALFQERVLQHFQPLAIDFHVPDERRYQQPLQIEECYALDGEGEALQGKTFIQLGWLLDKAIDLDTLLKAHLLSGVLLDNSSSPLLHALETTNLGAAPSPFCGLDDSLRELMFGCGLEGSEPERADEVEALIMEVLTRVAREGVEPERTEAVLHQLELSRREIGGDGFPYGLKVMLNALPAALHGGDAVRMLALDPVLDQLREEIKDPEFIKDLARTWLVDNPHRVRLVLRPDAGLQQERLAREAARLAAIKAAMAPEEVAEVNRRAEALKARQEQEDNPEILPKVELSDIPADLAIPGGESRPVAGVPCTWFNQPTNGLIYHQIVTPLPRLSDELTDILPLFASCLVEVGCGGHDYLTTQAWQSAVSGGVGASASVRGQVDDASGYTGSFVVSSKALARNQGAMVHLLGETFNTPRFNELDRLRELVAQMRSTAELKVTDNGHVLAMSAALSGMSPAAALANRWGGLVAIKRLKELDQALARVEGPAQLAAQFEELAALIRQLPRQLLVVAEEEHFPALEQSLAKHWQAPVSGASVDLAIPLGASQVRLGWAVPTQVNFCVKAYPAVTYTHADAPVLNVLGEFLKNGYLHRAIREQGGAYGSGAGYDSDACAFRFHSYRDPRLSETLADFDRAVAWVLETRHESRVLEEAILGVISAIDRPGSPAGEARRAFHDAIHGRTAERRRAYRQGVLNTTLDDLRRVAGRYLLPERASVAVVSNQGTLASHPELELVLHTL